MTSFGREHTTTLLVALVLASSITGCATTTAPSSGTEISSPLRAAAALPSGLSTDTRAQQLFVRALTEAQIGKHEEALNLFTEALRLAPGTPAILAASAESHAALGDETSAIYNARRAREAEPENIHYHFQLAQLLLSADQPQQAAEIYADLRNRFPNHPEVLFQLARAHTINGDYSEAVVVYKRLLEKIGDDRNVQNEILHLYTRMGDFRGMEHVLRDMLEEHPNDLELQKMLSQVFVKQGDREKATALLREAVAQQPGDAEVLLQLANLYREQGKADSADAVLDRAANLEVSSPAQLLPQAARLYGQAAEDEDARRAAEQMLERILEMDPENADALVMLGDIRLMQEEYSSAGELLYRSLEINPRDPQIWFQAAGAFLQGGDLSQTLVVADEGLLLFPGSLPLLRISGYALMDEYRNREAVERFNTALRIVREDHPDGHADVSEIYSALGLLHDRLNDFESSDRAYEQALEANPNNAGALNNYAYSLAERGVRLDEALQLALQAVEIDPESASVLDTLGWIYFKQGQAEEAVRWLEQAVDRPGASAAVFEHLGNAYDAMGRPTQARKAWQTALEMNPDSTSLKSKLESR